MRYAISTDAHVEVWTSNGPLVADVPAGEIAEDVDAAVFDTLIKSGLATPVDEKKSKKEKADVPAE